MRTIDRIKHQSKININSKLNTLGKMLSIIKEWQLVLSLKSQRSIHLKDITRLFKCGT